MNKIRKLVYKACLAFAAGETPDLGKTRSILWEDEEGTKIIINIFDSKEEDVMIQRYYDNDSVLSTENYKKGKRHGQYLKYSKFGTILVNEHYRNGKLHGEQHYYYLHGGIMSSEYYLEGVLREE